MVIFRPAAAQLVRLAAKTVALGSQSSLFHRLLRLGGRGVREPHALFSRALIGPPLSRSLHKLTHAPPPAQLSGRGLKLARWQQSETAANHAINDPLGQIACQPVL